MKGLCRLAGLLFAAALTAGAALWIFGLQSNQARDLAAKAPLLNPPLDHILVEKSARRLTGYRQGEAVLTMDIALGFTPTGDKQREGDGKTPEGLFHIDRRNDKSAYFLSLGLNYPRAEDRQRADRLGVDPGGDIFIHGQPNALPQTFTLPGDWTAGCVAVSNREMAQLWQIAPLGTSVEIRP